MFAWAVSEGPGRPLIAKARCGARAIVEVDDQGEYVNLAAQLDTTAGVCTIRLEQVRVEKLYDLEVAMVEQVWRKLHPGQDPSAYELATWAEEQALVDGEAELLFSRGKPS